MKTRNYRSLGILGVLCLSLALRADSCLVEQKLVSLILTANVEACWETNGWTESTYTDTQAIQAAANLRDAFDGDTLDGDIETVSIAGVHYKVKSNDGHSTRRMGWVDIDFGNGSLRLINFDVPHNEDTLEGTTGDDNKTNGEVQMVAAGINELNTRLNQWLDQYALNPLSADDSLLNFTYTAFWDSSTEDDPPTPGDPDNFSWTTDLVLHIEKIADVEVFKP